MHGIFRFFDSFLFRARKMKSREPIIGWSLLGRLVVMAAAAQDTSRCLSLDDERCLIPSYEHVLRTRRSTGLHCIAW